MGPEIENESHSAPSLVDLKSMGPEIENQKPTEAKPTSGAVEEKPTTSVEEKPTTSVEEKPTTSVEEKPSSAVEETKKGFYPFWKSTRKPQVPLVPIVQSVEESKNAEIKTPKVSFARAFSSLFEAYTSVVKELDNFGDIVAISVSGSEPRLKLSCEFSKIREANAAVKNLRYAEFSFDEPKRVHCSRETIRVFDFKGSIPMLYKFMLNESQIGITKVFVCPEDDRVYWVDLSLCGSAKKIADSLTKEALVFPWGRTTFSEGSPYYSMKTIDPIKIITGSDQRRAAVVENVPSFFNSELFKQEVSTRLEQTRQFTLDEIISEFELRFNSKLKKNGGEAHILFKTPAFLYLFYEEFEGFKFENQAKSLRLKFS